MPIFKCKMCGGALELHNETETVIQCDYCGTTQTMPNMDNEKKIALFNRANRLRFSCEFDKAANIYESIVAEFPEEAEAYWGLVLCKYGIEYVDDPATAQKIPTCHRSSFDSVFDDSNYEQVLENANTSTRVVYRAEAKQIEELRKGIIDISSHEEPYDIFICYKETADNGDRTIDSVIAQDVYTELISLGYRVFFSRITLEDKLGKEYEPYIFAALNSAKIMLAFGSDYEYYNAVWVKNEWSRFLQLMAAGAKKTLIPCYKGIDAYDMPKEFAKLQAQDMGKVGAIQDLLRGIGKILPPPSQTSTPSAGTNQLDLILAPLLKRTFMFLEDREWDSAYEYCEKVLDLDPECARAYLGKLMAECKVTKIEELALREKPFSNNDNYNKFVRFADTELSKPIIEYSRLVDQRYQEREIQASFYKALREQFANAKTEADYVNIIETLDQRSEIQDVDHLREQCYENIKPFVYARAVGVLNHNKNIDEVRTAKSWLQDIIDYKSSKRYVEEDCQYLEEVYALIEELNISQFSAHFLKIRDLEKRTSALNQEKRRLCSQLCEEASVEATNNTKKTARVGLFDSLVKKAKEKFVEEDIPKPITQPLKATKLNDAEIQQKIEEVDQQLLLNKSERSALDVQMEIEKTRQLIERLFSEKTRDFLRCTPYEKQVIHIKNLLTFMKMLQNIQNEPTFTFGSYNGEEIEWMVAEQQDSKVLIVSKDALESGSFKQARYSDLSWEKSDIRKYLNFDFINAAFNSFERTLIVETEIGASENLQYHTTFNDRCLDKVFLLSAEEWLHYFPNALDRICYPTRKLQQTMQISSNLNRYWVRTPGAEWSTVAFVDNKGNINYEGDSSNIRVNTIRPAMYIDMDKIYN